MPWAIAGGALVVGAGLGVLGGWFVWGRRPTELPPAEAEKQLAPAVNHAAATCSWNKPQKRTETTWQFFVDAPNLGCAIALTKAGLAAEGPCLEKGCTTGCCYFEIKPTGDHGSKWGTNGLDFTCGNLAFGKIVSISSKDNIATVTYTRTVTMDAALMKELEPCVLDNTSEPGEQRRAVTFRREDDGRWVLLSQ